MDWNNLLKPERLSGKEKEKCPNDKRNHFERDYSRMSLSYHVRRLQNKAQVFPLEEDDFIRTRLTHSMEVSCFARHVGTSLESMLVEKGLMDKLLLGRIPNILATAGLIHDLGNPPFGHSGEIAIRNFFNRNHFNHDIKRRQFCDFKRFDGNPQTFRVLTRLGINDYDLTLPTLATIIKYPCPSYKSSKYCDDLTECKFGYFDSEKDIYNKINTNLDLNNNRHPLTFILEAVDDIAYLICDVEDGYRKGLISLEYLIEEVKDFEQIIVDKDGIYSSDIIEKNGKREILIQKLRSDIQTLLLNEIIDVFFDKYQHIMDGIYCGNLLKDSKYSELQCSFKNMGKQVYDNIIIKKREIAGEKALEFLLNSFVNDRETYKNLIGPITMFKESGKDEYSKLRIVVDYVSGLTDGYALKLYQELNGYKL